jgi:hypothetical protein
MIELAKRVGSVPELAKNPTDVVLMGLLPGPDINQWFFGQIVCIQLFHFMVPKTFTPSKYMRSQCIQK